MDVVQWYACAKFSFDLSASSELDSMVCGGGSMTSSPSTSTITAPSSGGFVKQVHVYSMCLYMYTMYIHVHVHRLGDVPDKLCMFPADKS